MVILILIWILIGAAIGWRFGSRRSTSQALTQARQQMRQEIRYWQEHALPSGSVARPEGSAGPFAGQWCTAASSAA